MIERRCGTKLSDEVGFVVIGRNEGERLARCLVSVSPDLNAVVYVDSGSTDGSVLLAETTGAFVLRLDTTLPFTAARARNVGFAALVSHKPTIRFVQFIDGDCQLAEGWLASALEFIRQREDAAVVCGRRRERHSSASVYNRLCDIEWDTPIGESKSCGGDALVRVAAFEAAEGFRPDLIAGEEPELCVRLREKRWTIWRIDAEMTAHDAAMSRFRQWWRRSVRCGFAYAEVSRLHISSPFGIWRPEIARAAFWGGLLPAGICLGALIHPGILLSAIVYPLQVVRIALARKPFSSLSWEYAFLVTLAKFAEFEGILRYAWRQWQRRSLVLIEYK